MVSFRACGFTLAALLLSFCGSSTDGRVLKNNTRTEASRRLDPLNVKDFTFLLREIVNFDVDTDDWWHIKRQIGDIMEFGQVFPNGTSPSSLRDRTRRLRKLQTAENFRHDGSSRDFEFPCTPLPANPENDPTWNLFAGHDDLSSVGIPLAFAFTLYGITYQAGVLIYINNNGSLTIGQPYADFFSTGFPLDEFMPMVAPFFADIDTRKRGEVWYKMEGDKFSVIWDRVPRYNDADGAEILNTFQVVIARDEPVLAGRGNVCFCYTDMDWTTGRSSGGVNGYGGCAATVGVNAGDGTTFAQFGRFSLPGDLWDGGAGGEDGVDFLDGRMVGDEAICFNTLGRNVAPVFIGFPSTTISVPCLSTYKLSFTISTPELTETLTLETPDFPFGATLTTVRNDGVTMVLEFEWETRNFQEGTYALEFVATDSSNLVTTKVLMIEVGNCPDSKACVPIPNDGTCNGQNPRPFCTPFRSPEHCEADESFPTQISDRTDAVEQDPNGVESAGFWFHHLDDKIGGYIFSSLQNANAARLYCCVDDIDDLMSTCFPDRHNLNSFVIRANGHNSGRGIFALPNGFGDIELLRQIQMSAADVMADIRSLDPDPDKILVEEFLPGDGGLMTLPTEYKFHMFNGQIGSVSAIYNRAGTCGCYAEFDENFNRLDQFGCFEPGQPTGVEDRNCNAVDFEAGRGQLFQVKELDICSDPLPTIPACVWNDMRTTATRLSQQIGVYMRIDFFVSGNTAYVQEYSSNHNNGRSHCAARQDPATKCIDTCFLGELWKDTSQAPGNFLYGGVRTNQPSQLNNFRISSSQQQCDATNGLSPNNPPQSSC